MSSQYRPPTSDRSRRSARHPIFSLGGVRRTGWTLVLGLMGIVIAQACTDAQARSPLANAQETEEALVEAVLGALTVKDREALQGFLVSREEYKDLLWTELPDSAYTPFEFVWSLTEANNAKGIREAISEYGGLPLDFVSITFTEEPEVHQSFTLHPGAQVKVRRRDTGAEGILPSFDVFVEYGGRWKLLNLDEI